MINPLASSLPLHQFPRETISASAELHHFGIFDGEKHVLDRPIWVSDDYASALEYKNFGVAAPRYTKLVTAVAFEIVNLNGASLQPIAMKLNIPSHFEWNKLLAAYLIENGLLGLVYAGREILLAKPSRVIKTAEVCSVEA